MDEMTQKNKNWPLYCWRSKTKIVSTQKNRYQRRQKRIKNSPLFTLSVCSAIVYSLYSRLCTVHEIVLYLEETKNIQIFFLLLSLWKFHCENFIFSRWLFAGETKQQKEHVASMQCYECSVVNFATKIAKNRLTYRILCKNEQKKYLSMIFLRISICDCEF